MISALANMVTEWSEEKDNLLESDRLEGLHGEVDSLALRIEAYHWYKLNANTKDKIVRIKNTQENYTVSESDEFRLGEVQTLWAVNSSEGLKDGVSLKERAKERFNHRKLPLSEDFDDYRKIRSSCWILEKKDNQFYCNCSIGMKVL